MDLKKKKALWLVTESLKIILVAGPDLSWSRWTCSFVVPTLPPSSEDWPLGPSDTLLGGDAGPS